MAETLTYVTCQNLSNYHIMKHWSKWSVKEVVRELARQGLSRNPTSLKEGVLKGPDFQYVSKPIKDSYDVK